MYSYKINNSYTIYVNYAYINECIKASRKYGMNAPHTKTSSTKSHCVNNYPTQRVSQRNTVKIDSAVNVIDIDTQEKELFRIAYSHNTNIEDGIISVFSPVGNSLLGHSIGEIVIVHTPGGTIRYKICNISD